MNPACGNGTVLTTLFSNHSIDLPSASLLTPVGLRRVSIGPPISVMDAGWNGSSIEAMCATAASTGTAG